MNRCLHLLLIVVVLFLSTSSMAEEPLHWQQVRDQEGIKLYTAETGNTAIHKVKATAIIDVSLDRIVALLNDIERYITWVPYLKEARVLKRDSEDDLLVYSLFNAPWPVTDRDYVYRVRIDRQSGHVIYSMKTERSALMPEQRYAIRATLIESRYELVALNDHQTSMELMFYTDPRGSLPAWIINIVHESIPYDAVKELRRQVQRDQ